MLKIDKMTVLKCCYFAFLFFAVGLLVFYNNADKKQMIIHDPLEYIEHWTVEKPDGTVFTTGRSFQDDVPYEGEYSFSTILPGNVAENTFLCLRITRNAEIYVSGELRYEFKEKDLIIPGGTVKSFYIRVPLSPADSGSSLKVVRYSPAGKPITVPETILSTKSGIYNYLMDLYGLSFIMSLFLFVFAAAVILIGIGLQIRHKRPLEMMYGAIGVLDVAAWLVTNSYMFPFMFGLYHIDGIMNYIFSFMLPTGLCFYLDSVQKGRYRKLSVTVLIITYVYAIVFIILHFSGVSSFLDSLLVMEIFQGMTVAVACGIMAVDIKRGHFKEYRYTAIGFMGFIFFCIIEILVIVFITPKNDDIPMLLGLNFLLLFIVIQQIEDLNSVNEARQKAIALSDAKTKFLASMSHEIRTPINAILGMNEMILRENKDKVIDNYAKSVKSSGRMLLTLVNDVLDFSKIEAGKMEISYADYSLTKLLSEILPMVKERANAKSLELKTIVENEIPDGQNSDEFRIKQVLINLLNNAVKYTDKGSVTLVISGSCTDDESYRLELAVRDTGRGIKEDDIGALFDAFSRADIGKNRSIEGTGLGLAIVKSIMDSMGGEIKVTSAYGQGSEFKAVFPVKVVDWTPVREDLSSLSVEESEEEGCDYTAPYAKVLAVDDNHSNLTIVRLFLKRPGIRPDLCSSGKEAIELCKSTKYDLLLLDHMMPSPDGLETLAAIRKDAESLNRDTVAVVLTANAVAGSRQMYMEAGFADYLTKPLDSTELEQTVKKYLPADKVIPVGHAGGQMPGPETGSKRKETAENGEMAAAGAASAEKEEDYSVVEFLPSDGLDINSGKLRTQLSGIPEINFDTAMLHCGNDEAVLSEILGDISGEGRARAGRMRGFIENKDWGAYRIEAHAVKGLMATIGAMDMSDRAKKHEFAGRDQKSDFIEEDGGSFIDAYVSICDRITEALGKQMKE